MESPIHDYSRDELLAAIGLPNNFTPNSTENEDIQALRRLNLNAQGDPKIFADTYTMLEQKYRIGPNSTLGLDGNGTQMPLLFIATGGGEISHLAKPQADFLLKKGADLHKTVSGPRYIDHTFVFVENMDALVAATLNGTKEGVKYLLDKGANPAHHVGSGKTAFEFAIQKYNSEEDDVFAVGVLRVFLTHPRVKEALGDAEFNRITATMNRPLNKARIIESQLQMANQFPRSRHWMLQELKDALNIPYMKPSNLQKYTSKRQYNAFRNVLKARAPLGRLEENYMASFVQKPATFKVPPSETGLKHVNTSLFSGGRKTRKHRKHKKSTRRRN